ncbi:MAG: hypothetical protein NVS3B18_14220 [Candidatus Dormibacteria bacterium]
MIARRLVLIPAVMVLFACGSSQQPASSSFATGGGAPSARAGCVDTITARDIWTRIDNRLNQIVLDPRHQGLSDVATGAALVDLQQYIQTTLVANHLTEREVDSLDSLSIPDAACAGTSLQLTIATTPTRDDYLKPDGSVDHVDPAVGTHIHLLETYSRVTGVWKESDITTLDVPSPSAQVI